MGVLIVRYCRTRATSKNVCISATVRRRIRSVLFWKGLGYVVSRIQLNSIFFYVWHKGKKINREKKKSQIPCKHCSVCLARTFATGNEGTILRWFIANSRIWRHKPFMCVCACQFVDLFCLLSCAQKSSSKRGGAPGEGRAKKRNINNNNINMC